MYSCEVEHVSLLKYARVNIAGWSGGKLSDYTQYRQFKLSCHTYRTLSLTACLPSSLSVSLTASLSVCLCLPVCQPYSLSVWQSG